MKMELLSGEKWKDYMLLSFFSILYLSLLPNTKDTLGDKKQLPLHLLHKEIVDLPNESFYYVEKQEKKMRLMKKKTNVKKIRKN